MKLYVVRHGESETNQKKLWTGRLDVNLTANGENDAKKAGEFLKRVSFDKVYSSDLKRAVCTAEIAIPGCSIETSSLLREYNVGTLAGEPLSVLSDKQRAEIPQNGYIGFGGESKNEFCVPVWF